MPEKWIVQQVDGNLYRYRKDGSFDKTIKLSNGVNVNEYYTHNKLLMKFSVFGDATGYDWQRKFKNQRNAITTEMFFGKCRDMNFSKIKHKITIFSRSFIPIILLMLATNKCSKKLA
jgi:hypothetical protein